jgi:haloalkane dehalogenase
MKFARTPDECFANLPDYDFAPNYLDVDDQEGGSLRMHYLDEGPRDGQPILLLHGQPTWSYLYRNMIPLLADAGYRVLTPDLIGFGKSDKPTSINDYTYARHILWASDWLTQLDLTDAYYFGQDWGGLIGLRLVTTFPERFAGVVISNTGLPVGMIPEQFTEALKEADKTLPVVPASELGDRFRDTTGIPGFLYWRKHCAEIPELDIRMIMQFSGREIEADILDAYAAPFPSQDHVAGARKFPSLVPVFTDNMEVPANLEAWKVLDAWKKPFLLAFADNDPVTAGGDAIFLKRVPGTKGMPHRTIENAGHFVQEEQPEACVKAILDMTAAAQN